MLVAVHGAVLCIAVSIVVGLLVRTFYHDGTLELSLWTQVWSDARRWSTLLVNSLWIGGLAVGLAVVLGTALACVAFKADWLGRSVMVLVILLLACVPTYVILVPILDWVGLTPARGRATIAGLVHGIAYVPLVALLMGLALRSVDRELEEAALLHASPWRVVWHVSLPQAGGHAAAVMLILFFLVVSDFSVTDVLQVRCFAEEIYTQYALRGDRVAPLVIALPPAVVFGVTLVAVTRKTRLLAGRLLGSSAGRPWVVRLGARGTALAWSVLIALLAAFVWLVRSILKPIESWNRLRTDLLSIGPDWFNTVWIAAVTGAIVAFLSVGLAWTFLTKSRILRHVTGLMIVSLLAIPAPALALTVIEYCSTTPPEWISAALEQIGLPADPLGYLYDTPWIYVLTIGLRFLPIAVLIVLPAVSRIEPELEEVAKLEGACWFDLMRYVYWPRCWANALLAALVVAILTVGELDCAQIVAPPGIQTLSQRFFDFIHAGLNPQVAATSLALVATTLLPALLVFWIGRRALLGSCSK